MEVPAADGPTVLWRLVRGRSSAHATLLGTAPPITITWYFDGVMDRAENYESMDVALARSEYLHSVLLEDGWRDSEG